MCHNLRCYFGARRNIEAGNDEEAQHSKAKNEGGNYPTKCEKGLFHTLCDAAQRFAITGSASMIPEINLNVSAEAVCMA